MSKIIGRCYEGMASARHNISNGLDNSKKDGKALDLEKQVKKLTVEMGVNSYRVRLWRYL